MKRFITLSTLIFLMVGCCGFTDKDSIRDCCYSPYFNTNLDSPEAKKWLKDERPSWDKCCDGAREEYEKALEEKEMDCALDMIKRRES